jgi:DNA recombination protein RmuC
MVLTLSLVVGAIFLGLLAGYILGSKMERSVTAANKAALGDEVGRLTNALTARELQFETLRQRDASQSQQIAAFGVQMTRLAELQRELTGERSKGEEFRRQISDQRSQLAQMTTTLEAERQQSVEKLTLLTEAREQMTHQFKVLANEILEDKSKRFTEQNQANLDQLLDPLKTRLTEFQAKVEQLRDEGISGRTELKTHIGMLQSMNERLSQDANNLVHALKGSSKTQGDWGEFILERILEASGLRKGYEYRVQESFSREDGTRAKPDVIVDLPGGRHLIVDAKVSLLDYNEYCNCDEGMQREAALARHLASVRAHLKGLSDRNYQTLYGLKSLDFVVMFVPVEPAFMLAIARDGSLWQDAWKKSVLLVSPSTLLFVVRTVAQLWDQDTQNRNVEGIFNRGRALYDKLAAFAIDLTAVGTSLDAARRNYDEAFKKLSSGRGSAINQAQMLLKLGVKATKSMPPLMLDAALADPLDESESLSLAAETDVEASDEIDSETPIGQA